MEKLSESDEQIVLSESLTLMKIPHYSLRNEESIKSMGYLMKRKRMGWRSGVSDMMVYIPAEMSYVGRALILFIELKKAKRVLLRASSRGKKGDLVSQNSPTPEQLDFIDKINKVKDTQGFVAYGADEAIAVVNKFLIKKT